MYIHECDNNALLDSSENLAHEKKREKREKRENGRGMYGYLESGFNI
jgi:hypothetical protein